ncbi:hypothetical protein N431DRAFT_137126 [Stipitochalara longipes BDJ]|nr:hypothetical protein N431DRAFT_137126 [Stipitochalara longipes BDJ]
MLPQNNSALHDPFHPDRFSLHQKAPKRGQKAATMSDRRWEPALDRIRQLYVVEGKPIKEVREKINAEFGFSATERQYKARISKMKLERKCTIEQRKTILRHVQHRKEKLGKQSMYVRVRGHMLTQEKIARWLKEPALAKALSRVRPPSPLPTEISIRTAVHLSSPRSSGGTLSCVRFLDETESSAALRILDNAQQENQVMDPQQARSLFNDIQQLLETRDKPPQKMKDPRWRPSLENNLVHIRNMMNLGPKLLLNQNNPRKLAKQNFKFAAWQTQHGRMELSFWSARTDVDENKAEKTKYFTSTDLARITLFTRSRMKRTVCVNLDFNPRWDLPMKLTYQAMVPNDSEVFKIVEAGDVEALERVLDMKTASLTDRDEDGRSLLSMRSQTLE